MKVPLLEVSRQTGLSPIQVLFELAKMGQPLDQCWPECDAEFAETLRVRTGIHMRPGTTTLEEPEPTSSTPQLPVSRKAASVLNKLLMKNYGAKPVQVYTLIHKWVHGASEDDIEQLVRHGNLEFMDGDKSLVRLRLDHLRDSRSIVETLRTQPNQ